jgi:hypothetical protein
MRPKIPGKSRRKTLVAISLFALGIALVLFCTSAQPPASPASVTVTVTALGQGYLPAIISSPHISASSGKSPLHVASWVHPQGNHDSLQLAILIDNNVKDQLAGEPMQDLANFIRSQPPNVSIGVFFAQQGKATETSAFTSDHSLAAGALAEANTSDAESLRVYPSLSDLASHWPTPAAAHREILLVGSGYDVLLGGMLDPNMNAGNSVYIGNNYDPNISGERDPYLNSIMEAVQQAGIVVHSIYVPDPRFAQMVQADIMRDRLIQVSSETGGLAFFNGDSATSFGSYLRQLNNALRSQYLLTLVADPAHKSKGELRSLRVETDVPGVTIFAPRQIFVPGS